MFMHNPSIQTRELMTIDEIYHLQRKFFNEGESYNVNFRKEQLKALLNSIQKFEKKMMDATYADLGKNPYVSYISEIAPLVLEIKHTLRNIDKWVKPKKVSSPFILFPSKSYIYRDPLGLILIIGSWNYPFTLNLQPLVGAIAAGNCVILKPSELTPASSAIMAEMIHSTFDPGFISVVQGGKDAYQDLIKHKFDHIFFTGSRRVGQIVLEDAARQFTPVTLELGGKSPCIVAQDADLHVTARRILWGKFINSGQTCLAPDYVLVDESIVEPLTKLIIHYIEQFYPNVSYKNFQRIINPSHFQRLIHLLEGQSVIYGGIIDQENLYISPTLVRNPRIDDPIMQEEIFGPILPIIPFKEIDSVISMLSTLPKPLALYLFTNNDEIQEKILHKVSFGGGCINDTCLHAANYYLPFGGIGESGIGAYHGKYTFDLFSHPKSILKRFFSWDFLVRYPPDDKKLKFIKKII